MTIDEWAEEMRALNLELFSRDGRLQPMAIALFSLHPKTGELLDEPMSVPIVPMDRMILESREEFAQAIRKVVKQYGALAVCYFTQIFMKRKDREAECLLFYLERKGVVAPEGWAAEIYGPGGAGPYEKLEQLKANGPIKNLMQNYDTH